MKPMPENDLKRRVIGRAIEVQRHLGPGLPEKMYETCLCDELSRGWPDRRIPTPPEPPPASAARAGA